MATWLITGCSTGIGRALASAALDRGENVAVTARDAASVEDLARSHPRTALALPLDVTNHVQGRDVVRAALRSARTSAIMHVAPVFQPDRESSASLLPEPSSSPAEACPPPTASRPSSSAPPAWPAKVRQRRCRPCRARRGARRGLIGRLIGHTFTIVGARAVGAGCHACHPVVPMHPKSERAIWKS